MMNLIKRLFKKPEDIKGTGGLSDPVDDRDYRYEELIGRAPSVDWTEKPRSAWGGFPIFDQDGSSSCFPYDAPVLMEDLSYKPISEVCIGDSVVTHKGRTREVTKTFQRKWQGNTKKVKLWGDYEQVEATEEHPFWAIKRPDGFEKKYTEGKPDFYELNQLSKGDWVGFPLNNRIERDTYIYCFETDPNFLWVLGLYLAEGSLGKYNVSFSININEKEEFGKMVKETMTKYGANVSVNETPEASKATIRVYGKKWVKIFRELGSEYCDKKKINKRLMFLSPKSQMEIVKGYIAGDGHEQGNTVIMVSTSKELLKQIRTILLRNKRYSSLQKRKEREGRKQAWALEYSENSRYSFVKGDWCFVSIKEIQDCHNFAGGHVYNLEVEDDSSYIVNGVAVHNCVGQTVAKILGIENFLEEGRFVRFSARDIYSRGYVKPSGGMYYREGMKIGKEYGSTVEQLMPSQNKGEQFMRRDDDRTVLTKRVGEIGRGGKYVAIPLNPEAIANVIDKGKAVSMGVRFNSGEFSKPVIKTTAGGQYGHAIVGVDYTIYNGKKAIIFDNSWGEGWGWNGQGVLTEDNFDGVNAAWYYENFSNAHENNDPEIPKPNYSFKIDLSYGDRRDDVAKLQEVLKYERLFPPDVPCTGYFGGITLEAVKKFQEKYREDVLDVANIAEPTGFVGPLTRNKLNELF